MNPEWRRMQLVKLREEYEDVCRLERESKVRNENLFDQINRLDEQNIAFALNNEKLKQIKDHYKEYVMKIWPVMRDSYHIQRQVGVTKNDKGELRNTGEELLVNRMASQPTTLKEFDTFSSFNTGGISSVPNPQTSTPTSKGRSINNSISNRIETRSEQSSPAKAPSAKLTELFPKLRRPLERTPQLSTTFQPVLTCPPQLPGNKQNEQQTQQNVKVTTNSNRTSSQSTTQSSKQTKESMLLEDQSKLKDDLLDTRDTKIFTKSSDETVNTAYEKLIKGETKPTMQPEEEISESEDDVENEMMAVMSSINPIETNDDIKVDTMEAQNTSQQLIPSAEETTTEKKTEVTESSKKLQNKSKSKAFRFDLESDSDVDIAPLETDKNSDKDDFSFFD